MSRANNDAQAPAITSQIEITQYINPHLFWFKWTDDLNFGNPSLDTLELDVLQHVNSLTDRQIMSLGYRPQRLETVALYHLPWKKWIRARVDEVLEFSDGHQFVLWTIDHGTSIESKQRHIRPLTDELARRPVRSVRCAGLANVMPAELSCKYPRTKMELCAAPQWTEGAVRHMEELLNDGVEICFDASVILEDGDDTQLDHHFGTVNVRTHAGDHRNAAEMLLEVKWAMWLPNDEFNAAIGTAPSCRLQRWKDNQGQCVVGRRNEFNYGGARPTSWVSSTASGAGGGYNSGESGYLENDIGAAQGGVSQCSPVAQKIADWIKRNPHQQADPESVGDGRQNMLKTLVVLKPTTMPRPPRHVPVPVEPAAVAEPTAPRMSKLSERLERLRVDSQSSIGGECEKPPKTTEGSASVRLPAVMRDRIEMRKRLMRSLHEERERAEKTVEPVAVDSVKREPLVVVPAAKQPAPAAPQKFVPAGFALSDLHTFNKREDELQLMKPATKRVGPPALMRIMKPQTASRLSLADSKCLENSLHQFRILVHGVHRPEPLESIKQANFTTIVHDGIRHYRYTELYRTQAYTWPHLLRGNSIMLINGPGTGKTIAYLPAVCSLVQEMYNDGRVPKATVGPVAIIMCVSAKVVACVAKLARRFMAIGATSVTEWTVVEAYGRRHTKQHTAQLINGCAILVTTAPCWHRLLAASHQPLFDARRLRLLVLDDLDLIMERFLDDFTETYRRMLLPHQQLQRQQAKGNASGDSGGLQLAITSRKWHPKLSCFFAIGNMALVIGGYAEAAVYARSEMQLQMLPAGDAKLDELVVSLRERDYRQQPTVVVCNDAFEAIVVAARLRSEMIDCVLYHEKDLAGLDMARHWNRSSEPGGVGHAVLVCTDKTIGDLKLSWARNIVHYSIPSTWTAFAFRCSSSFDYFEDFVRHREPVRPAPHSLILLDGQNTSQLPRLCDFIESHGNTAIDPVVRRLTAQIRLHEETGRRSQLVPFCGNMLLVGECIAADCPRRHVLTTADRSAAGLPFGGHVRMVVNRVETPTSLHVRLVEYRLPGQQRWTKATHFVGFSVAFASFYAVEENRRTHVPAALGDLCVIEELGVFHRCRVTEVKKSQMSASVKLNLIDVGQQLPSCHPNELLHLDDQFRSQPAQSVIVHIADCVPCDGAAEWEASATEAVREWLVEHSARAASAANLHVEGRVEFTVLNEIWVDSVRLIERLPTLANNNVHLLSVRHELVRQQFGEMSTRASQKLLSMAAEAGVVVQLEEHSQSNGSDSDNDDQIEPPTIISDAKQTVTSCAEIPPPPTVCRTPQKYPASTKLSSSSQSPRSSSDDRNGCTQTSSMGSMSPPLTIVRKLPGDQQQSARWANMAEGCFHPVFVTAFYTPALCYVQIYTPILKNLDDAIDKYTADAATPFASLADATVGCICLAPFEGRFERARIDRLACTSEDHLDADLFFVDLGQCTKRISIDLLRPLPDDKLLQLAPFQAVRCSLVGVQPLYGESEWSEECCDRIYDDVMDSHQRVFVRVVRILLNANAAGDAMHTHEVVAIGCDGAAGERSFVNLNREMVEQQLAAYAPETEILLDIEMTEKDVETEPTAESDADDGQPEENWDESHHPSYLGQLGAAHKADDHLDDDKEYDVQITEEEIMDIVRSIYQPPAGAVPNAPLPFAAPATNALKAITTAETTCKSSSSDDESDNSTSSDDEDESRPTSAIDCVPMPRLRVNHPYKQPQIRWQQNDAMICLSIETPDVTGYRLEVVNRVLRVTAHLLQDGTTTTTVFALLHLYGAVDNTYTSHQVRGLWLRVRLMKLMRGPMYSWPRLTRQTSRMPWLRYNLDTITVDETGDRWRQQYRAGSESSDLPSSGDEANKSMEDFSDYEMQ